jgi:hypothetical protein
MISRIAWCAAAAAGLGEALPAATLAIVAGEVQRGVSMLWDCSTHEHHAYCVTRVDGTPLQLVIVAFQGSGMHVFAPAFIAAAQSRGLAMRAHTVSPIVARLIRKFGFQQREFVCRRAA